MMTSALYILPFLSCLLLSILTFLIPKVQAGRNNRCSIVPSYVHINEIVEDRETNAQMFCSGLVEVNMCEGRCRSWELPSTTSPNGFDKVCKCCQEKQMRQSSVYLTECRDQRGTLLDVIPVAVTITEPAACRCQLCTL